MCRYWRVLYRQTLPTVRLRRYVSTVSKCARRVPLFPAVFPPVTALVAPFDTGIIVCFALLYKTNATKVSTQPGVKTPPADEVE